MHRKKAEEAVSHPYGVMDSNDCDAYDNITATNYKNGLASVNSWGRFVPMPASSPL